MRAREAIADAAARIVAHQGVRDFSLARRKAGARLGIDDERLLPTNEEIEAALRARQNLFAAATQQDALRVRREAAAAAMEFLAGFQPRLAGTVLEGSADGHTPVCLHLFSDDMFALMERLVGAGIPFDQRARRVRFAGGREAHVPLFSFEADDVAFELMLFDRDGLREAPLDTVHARPQRRAARAEVLALLGGLPQRP